MSNKKQFTGGKTSRSNSKQSASNPMTVRKRFSSLCSPPNNQKSTPCVFCQKFKNCKEESYAPLLNKALFAKYSSSQNYYYSKDINDIIEEESTPAVVFYRDLESMIEEEEYLKRSYVKKEAIQKVKALQEYYKYHKDIPRLFMQNVYLTINKFHEKKRRLEYANIKRKLNIPDEDVQPSKKKEKKKQKHSDEDLTIGQLKYLLKDLKLDTNSYLQKKVDISSSVQLREFIQQVGQKYDCLGQISGLLSIDQSNSFLLRSQDLSTITKNLKSNYMTNLKPKVNKSSQLQNFDSKTTHQVSCQGSFDKININRLQFNQGEVSSLKAENSLKAGEQTKRSNQEQSPQRSSQQSQLMQKVYSQIEGFANFVQQQQNMQKQQKANNAQKSNSQRKVSSNFNTTECQFRLPSRQNSTQKQTADLLSYQVNFLTRVASQLQKYEDDNKSKQPLATDRVQRQSVYTIGEQTLQKTASKNIQKLPQKFTQYALSTLRGLQVKNSDQKKKSTLISNNNLQAPILNAQLMHYRTKSQDNVGNYKGSPPKQPQKHDNSKDPLRITNNICVQGSSKKGGGVYNINQNNIVNIYIEDLKSSTKLKQGGSQTARISSPLKSNPKGIFEVYNTQRSNLSPVSKKMA
ncbi:unnamed protein product (macronuclear) [Paramecium tetraurelia]|uniref:Uncharacterized protein n=1 Tax=Paramecium tetraurelia TaxID=5888 RepID=A0BPW9_PARTE|nr:uncharacterized protein GSPATT00005336001 [Paramecium tetraurelia]CAK60586.1 unnamed protein product [Paramecium tetraurelia]|eukprot:XP_001427984.1 hypothetical protein (macronuclear) [Paramecium tetraurelia strain d4-2]